MSDLRLEGFVSGGASLSVCASCGRVWLWVQVLLAATLMSTITLGGMVLHLVLHTRDPTVHGGAGEYIPLGALLVRHGPTTSVPVKSHCQRAVVSCCCIPESYLSKVGVSASSFPKDFSKRLRRPLQSCACSQLCVLESGCPVHSLGGL